MEPKQEKWINGILDSVNGLQRTEPSPFLFAKIHDRLHSTKQSVYVPVRAVWLGAASFTLLALLNWQLITTPTPATTTQTVELNTVMTDMQLYPTIPQLYDAWSEQNY